MIAAMFTVKLLNKLRAVMPGAVVAQVVVDALKYPLKLGFKRAAAEGADKATVCPAVHVAHVTGEKLGAK